MEENRNTQEWEDKLPTLPIEDGETTNIIKVFGVGGGGSNAINHMYRKGIKGVSFVVCNTDLQALRDSPVPCKLQIGNLGAGSRPQVAEEAAKKYIDRIKEALGEDTRMVFVTAGMGGGTGTGAAPIVAQVAKEMGILTVGIVTIPFAFEGKFKITKAFQGVATLSKHVDALLVINNQKLCELYADFNLSNAFAKADDVLANAAKAIAEIVTIPGYINIDFADVETTMHDSKVAVMNTGYAEGENRIKMAIEDALNSPIVNTTNIKGARNVLLSFYCSRKHQIEMKEVQQIHDFMDTVGDNVEVIWGATYDDSLDKKVKITLIATGFDIENIPGLSVYINPDKKTEEQTKEVTSETAEPNSEEEIIEMIKNVYGKQTPSKEEEKKKLTKEDEVVEVIEESNEDDEEIEVVGLNSDFDPFSSDGSEDALSTPAYLSNK